MHDVTNKLVIANVASVAIKLTCRILFADDERNTRAVFKHLQRLGALARLHRDQGQLDLPLGGVCFAELSTDVWAEESGKLLGALLPHGPGCELRKEQHAQRIITGRRH